MKNALWKLVLLQNVLGKFSDRLFWQNNDQCRHFIAAVDSKPKSLSWMRWQSQADTAGDQPISQRRNIAVGFFTILLLQPTATEIVAKNGSSSFFWISIESIQRTCKLFFTLAAYKLHALCVNKNFPVQPLPLIILPFGFEESYSAGRPLRRTYQLFHPESILSIPRQLMVWRAYVLPENWRLFTFLS